MARAHMSRRPDDKMSPSAPQEMVKTEFARRLQRRIAEKGWNQSELGRRAEEYLPEGQSFGRYNISGYIRGITLPGPVFLNALARALECEPTDLIPSSIATPAEARNPPLEVKDAGDGKAWVRVNQAVEWSVALKIMELLKGEN